MQNGDISIKQHVITSTIDYIKGPSLSMMMHQGSNVLHAHGRA